MSTNRVVVTGYGVTSPIGNTPEEFGIAFMKEKLGSNLLRNLMLLKFQSLMLVKFKISHSINIL